MKIDKSFLREYLRNSKENEYILNLYKIYELCSKVTDDDVLKHKKLLNNLEDKIYTINGKTMPQSNRILYETKKIINKPLDNNPKVLKERDELLKDIVDLDINDTQTQKHIKNRIVVLEAKIDLPINFLYNACLSLANIYSSIYINEILLKNYDDIKINNVEIYNLNEYDLDKIILKNENYIDKYIKSKEVK